MTDNEIMKALECHLGVDPKRCPNCKYTEFGCYCLDKLHPDLLDLINRQKAELESLKKVAETQQSLAMERHFEIERLKAEFKGLRAEKLKWISVEDRLPEPFVSVLGAMTDAGEFPAVRECYAVGGKSFYFPALEAVHPVSHWMPMPEPPKEDEGK